MASFTQVLGLIPALRGRCAGVASTLPLEMNIMDDETVVAALTEATELAKQIEQVRLAASGIVATRSARDAGHSGLAQSRGHRNASAMIQDVTGTTRAEANRMSRVGQTLLDDSTNDADHDDGTWVGDEEDSTSSDERERERTDDRDDAQRSTPPPSWHTPLSRALMDGTITAAQHDVIRRGLGEPPAIDPVSFVAPRDADRLRETWRDAWQLAAEQLIAEAAERTVEELGSAARLIRDQLDPEGAAARFEERYARRSFRLWTDADGVHHGSFIFDDEAAALIRTIHDAALRPRRGGPRFVDSDERAAAKDLTEDPRTNDQLAHDLMIDVLRAGALADAKTVFGTRQAGVRLVQTVNTDSTHGPAHTEDGATPVPAAFAAQRSCDIGIVPITIDNHGNPLDVGREQRLFTTKQRIALGIRDGGCRWNGCDRPASYCEAHHIDHWVDGGCTDIDRGILLCRFHHLQLHNGGWSITRDPGDEFILHDARGNGHMLSRRLALRYAFNDIDPQPRRFRAVA